MYRKILLAYDCSTFRPALVHRCAELAQRCNAQLHILGVVVTTGAMAIAEAVGPPNVWAREKADLKRAIDPVVASLQAQGMEVTAFIRRGAPAEQIAAHAHALGHRPEFAGPSPSSSQQSESQRHLCPVRAHSGHPRYRIRQRGRLHTSGTPRAKPPGICRRCYPGRALDCGEKGNI